MTKSYIVDVNGPHDTTTIDEFLRQKSTELAGWHYLGKEGLELTQFKDSDGAIISYYKQFRITFAKV